MDRSYNMYEEDRYKILFKEFYHPLVCFVLQYLNDHEVAEDLVQDLFVHLWTKELKFKDKNMLRAYLYRSARHKCFNYLRNLKIQQHHERKIIKEQELHESFSVLHNMIREEVYRQLFDSIDRLPPQCKKICLMTLDGKKPSEIAAELHLAVETVKKQKKIAQKRIQDEWGISSSVSLLFSFWIL